jgi:hypothetical protein
MKNVMKNVIVAGGFKLADIQYKIKKLYAMGDISESEMDELLILASGGVSVDAERPEVLAILTSLSERIDAIEERVKALEGNTDEGEQEEYPVWKPWDGISKDYQKGAIVSHNGELWESTYEGQNVWQPGTVGDNFWLKKV